MATPTQRNTLEQGRAAHAYKKAEAQKASEDYRTAAKKLPMYIKTNGLGAAMAFFKSKNPQLYNDITDWLRRDECVVKELIEWEKCQDLVACLVGMPSVNYRAVTVEVMAYLNWLRRFADGFKKA